MTDWADGKAQELWNGYETSEYIIDPIAQALRDEREACAKIADQFRQEWNGTALRDRTKGAEIIAAAIRNRP